MVDGLPRPVFEFAIFLYSSIFYYIPPLRPCAVVDGLPRPVFGIAIFLYSSIFHYIPPPRPCAVVDGLSIEWGIKASMNCRQPAGELLGKMSRLALG